jgi:hypothetical protein
MKDKPISAGIILMLLTLVATPFLAGCGDFWEAPTSTGTTASTTTLTASPTSTAATGTSVTLTATVASSTAGGATPTGTVTFYSGATKLGTGTLSSGTATLSYTFDAPGTLSLTADYGGSSTYATSVSTALSYTVTGLTITTTTLTANPTSPGANDPVTLTATVTPAPTSTTNETVTFYNGTTSIGTGTLSSGTATLTTSFSPANTYSLTATYIGDSTYATSTSTVLSLVVSSTSSTTNCGLQDSANSVDAIAAIAYATSGSDTLTSPFITVSTANESALCAEGSGTDVTVSDPTIVSSSVGSNSTDSNYSGTNAAVLAYGSSATSATGGSIAITGGTINTTGNYGNGAFASGDGATISLSGTAITTGSSTDLTTAYAHGVDAAEGGSLTLNNVTVTTYGPNSPAIGADHGGGTVTVTNGTYTAGNAEAAVVESPSTVTLTGSTLNSTMGNYRGILLSQSGSSVGTSSFTMSGGSLTYTCDETATASCADGVPANGTSFPATLFAVADTTAAISLTDVTVTNDTPTTSDSNGTLLEAEALNGSTVASNAIFTAKGETLTGDVIVDAISTVALTLNEDSSSVPSTLTGAINNAGSAGTVSLTLDSASSWTVTATSNLTTLSGLTISGSNVVSNIDGGGHCVYYSDNINGASSTATYTLSGANAGYLARVGATGLTCI